MNHTPTLTRAEVDTIVSYYRITHPTAQPPDIDALRSTLEHFEPSRSLTRSPPSTTIRLATALCGAGAAGLATALIAPSMPLLIIGVAAAGAWLGWREDKVPATHPNN